MPTRAPGSLGRRVLAPRTSGSEGVGGSGLDSWVSNETVEMQVSGTKQLYSEQG